MSTNVKKVSIKEHLNKLGIEKLKPEQKTIITAVLNGRDAILNLKTGGGKSLCYILPHFILNKIVIVITPLISLMKDQKTRYGVHCKVVLSNGREMVCDDIILDDVDRKKIYDGKDPCVIYMTPENFIKRKDWVRGMEKHICLIAIDECHCISSWSDFRDGYANLKNIKSWFETSPSIMALTGTATEETIREVSASLNLTNPLKVHIAPTRDNLSISVHQKTKMKETVKEISLLIEGKTIIYCKTQKDTEKVSSHLRGMKIKAGYYHAGMDVSERTQMQDLFTKGEIAVMAATIAFGMGIDISDIETIIHFGLPKDMESYCQEIGRAARKPGMNGNCYIFWGKSDFVLNNIFLKNIGNDQLRIKQKKQMRAMENFVNENRVCRMQMIGHYFGHHDIKECSKCDNCTKLQSFLRN